jgi:hypothetical protein
MFGLNGRNSSQDPMFSFFVYLLTLNEMHILFPL